LQIISSQHPTTHLALSEFRQAQKNFQPWP